MPKLKPEISKEQLIQAYFKLKSHIYYDTTELFQRRLLAEFETNLLTNRFLDKVPAPYGDKPFGFNIDSKLEQKFDKILEGINNSNSGYFEQFLQKINLI